MKNSMTKVHIQTLREGLRGHPFEALFTLALVAGMRRDELLLLTWQQIDLEKHELRIWNSKTKSSSRLIHLPQEVVQVLLQHRLCQMEKPLEAVPDWQHLDLVFPNHTGGQLRPQHLLEEWYKLLEYVGLPRLRFHDLRVFVWRRMLEQGQKAQEKPDYAQDGSLDRDKNADDH